MRVRVKHSSASQVIDFEQRDASSVTLRELRQAVSSRFQLENQDFNLSLNRRDVLSGDDQSLAHFHIVSGDLLYVIGAEILVSQTRSDEQVQHRPQPLVSHSRNDPAFREQNADHTVSSASNEQLNFSSSSECGLSMFSAADGIESNMDVSTENEDLVVPSLSQRYGSSEHSDINRCLQEPLVVRESTGQQVPALLSQMYLSANCNCNTDALWVVLHTIMLESGFLPNEADDPTTMPKDFKKSGYYSLSYEYPVSVDTVKKCSLIGVPIGSTIAVHGLSSEADFKTDHLQLKAPDYVRTLSSDVPVTYKALDRLSRQFKDTVCLALINGLATAAGFPECEGLQALPHEAKVRIMSFLDAKSLVHLGQTCHEFNSIYRDRIVWRILFIRDFGRPDDCSLTKNWYEVRYQQWKEEWRNRRGIIYLDETDPPWGLPELGRFRTPFPNFPFPHLIGGEYDVNPEFDSGIHHPLGRLTSPRVPSDVIPNPFSSGLGVVRLPGRPRSGAGNMTGSPFASGSLRRPFDFL